MTKNPLVSAFTQCAGDAEVQISKVINYIVPSSMNEGNYIVINIKRLQYSIKTEEHAYRYHSISASLLDIPCLHGCLT